MAGLRRSVFTGPLAELAHGVIDQTVDFAGCGMHWSELLQAAPASRFDIVIATEPKLRNAILMRRLKPRLFISPALNFFLSDRKPTSPYPVSVYEQMLRLAELAVGRDLSTNCKITPPRRFEDLATHLLPESAQYIGFAPGAGGERKRWPLARFIALAQEPVAFGYKAVFFLGPEELDYANDIQSAIPSALFPEQSNLIENHGGPMLGIALAARLQAAVANDAGSGHILAAGGRPLVTLFGHTNSEKFKPPFGRRIAIPARDYGGEDVAKIPLSRVRETLMGLLSELS